MEKYRTRAYLLNGENKVACLTGKIYFVPGLNKRENTVLGLI